MQTLRIVGPPVLALLAVLAIDYLTWRRGLLPCGFQLPSAPGSSGLIPALLRRGGALIILWLVLWVGVFEPLGALGLDVELDLSQLRAPQLFLLHGLFAFCLVAWYLLGFVGVGSRPRAATESWTAQLGWRTRSIGREIGIGLIVGVAAWLAVLGVSVAIGLAIWWLGGEELLPTEPPELIPWIAALPIALRVAISLSAGVAEEAFFRGFLQPRVGIVLSTGLFVLAHASYEQPIMLVGIAFLSLIYGGLVYWRQNIWPAIAAHALFDTIQLLVVIPAALKILPEEGEGVLVPVAQVVGIGRVIGCG